MTGEPIIRTGLVTCRLQRSEALLELPPQHCGGFVVFEGSTRSPDDKRVIEALEYEAWETRTEAQLETIALEVARRHDLGAAVILHRVGRVPAGDVAVIVAAAAAHRDAAFVAARELIDRTKTEAWIWKREIGPAGEAWADGCVDHG